MDYDISMPNTINNMWYPKIRKSLVLDNGLNANHDLEKGGLENSWVLNIDIDYSDLNNRDALYNSDDTDDDNAYNAYNANNDRYDRNDIGFIDFGVETTRGTPKSNVCEFDEYGNYVIKLEAKLETERYLNWIIPKKVDKKSKSRFSLDKSI